MSILIPIEEIDVVDFKDFCSVFKIYSNSIEYFQEVDEILIIKELNKISDFNFVLNYINNKSGGFFRIQKFK
jgi:hypothetical protein